MKVRWTLSGSGDLGGFSPDFRSQVRSEVDLVFASEIPATSMRTVDGTRFAGLPCGAEIHFEEVGDEVRIFEVDDRHS